MTKEEMVSKVKDLLSNLDGICSDQVKSEAIIEELLKSNSIYSTDRFPLYDAIYLTQEKPTNNWKN